MSAKMNSIGQTYKEIIIKKSLNPCNVLFKLVVFNCFALFFSLRRSIIKISNQFIQFNSISSKPVSNHPSLCFSSRVLI